MQTFRKFLALGVVVLILASPAIVWQHHYEITDWWRLRAYTPPPAVAKLADETAMNDYGRRLFYVNTPQLDNKQVFNNDCSFPEATIVLGCYVSNKGIYVLQVEDVRLNGVEEVTAAHEMLHAAYERLSAQQKSQVDGWLKTALDKLQDDRINKTLAGYRARDPRVVNNEMHSILGTEVRNVGPDLENYYKQYFLDRGKVVDYSEQYEQVFTDIKTKVEAYDNQLSALKDRITVSQTNLDAQFKHLQSQKDTLNDELAARNFAAYNAGVPEYNSNVRDYNANLNDLQQQIESYNAIVNERNSVAIEQRQLVQAIDSKALPQAQ